MFFCVEKYSQQRKNYVFRVDKYWVSVSDFKCSEWVVSVSIGQVLVLVSDDDVSVSVSDNEAETQSLIHTCSQITKLTKIQDVLSKSGLFFCSMFKMAKRKDIVKLCFTGVVNTRRVHYSINLYTVPGRINHL